MPKNLEEKIENTTAIIKAWQILWNEIKKSLYAIIVFFAFVVFAVKNPELVSQFIMKSATKSFIHDEVVKETNTNYVQSPMRVRDSLYIVELEKQIKHVKIIAAKAASKSVELDRKIDVMIEIQDANQLHRQFNTNVSSIQSDLLCEMMEKKSNSCNWIYYKTHNGDAWKVFNDKYESRVPYSLDLRSGCRAFYTPLGGSKTLAN